MIYEILPVNNYQGNGSSTTFDFDFYIENETQLCVYLFDDAGAKHQLELNVDYSINELKNKNGSFITFPLEGSEYGVLNSSQKISLELVLPISQETQYNNSSLLNLEALEYSLDYLTRLIQIIARKIALCVKVEECSDNTPDELFESINQSKISAINCANAAQTSANNALTSANNAYEQAQIALQKASDVSELVSKLNGIDDSLAGKMNINASNISSTGKANITALSFPSTKFVELSLGASGSSYTAPADGYFQLKVNNTGTNQWISMYSTTTLLTSGTNVANWANYDLSDWLPVRKGDSIKISYYEGVTGKLFRFIYAQGES